MFLKAEDFEALLTAGEFETLTGGNEATWRTAEAMAVSKIKHMIGARYDTDAMFTAQAAERDPTLVEYTAYFTLYILYTRIAKQKVPDDRYEQYREARDFFNALARGEITCRFPVREIKQEPLVRLKSDYPKLNW